MIKKWLLMCAIDPEFVANYNRLRGTSISFDVPSRTPLEAAIDACCGFSPTPKTKNDDEELRNFFMFCVEVMPPAQAEA